ncbi:MAG: hypothetical protein CVU09_08405 [Bacteroidetes bacterium HGW-Bacteroidetes-4]|jgi:hypothetical protein|nr:MAG: hypothetical protein CVU09_08405 [Bacteroidetes bacterium HGW-Bacteroidetes-4]
MKKTKKNIKQFKQALLTNTGFIKQNEEPEPIPAAQHESLIESDILQKFTLLAEFEGTNTKELINKALNHFLRLKSLQLEEAMKKQND